MPIEPNFKPADVSNRFDKFIEAIESRQIKRLQQLGETCVKMAREIPPEVGFMDQTGNLRSSIGYMVFRYGVAVHEGYQGTAEGIKQGQILAKKWGEKYKNGIALVVTAGMHYAIYLEAAGRDVLTSAELFAKQQFPKIVAELKKNIDKVNAE